MDCGSALCKRPEFPEQGKYWLNWLGRRCAHLCTSQVKYSAWCPVSWTQAGHFGGSFLLRHILASAGSRRLLAAHQFSKSCFDQWRGNPPYTEFIPHVSQIVLAAFVNADLTRATCHLRLDKELKGSFSACLFLIDIKNENKNRGFLTPWNPCWQKSIEFTGMEM